MIFVDRNTIPAPVELAYDPKSLAGKERVKSTTFYNDRANDGKNFDFKVYKVPGVLKALDDLFHAKCAYCESNIGATQPTDVEHFRPKGGYDVYDKTTKGYVFKPRGYYWLAATWENLLPSCIHCNRESYHQLQDGTVEKVGKANKFPLLSERTRASKLGQEKREKPLLLNPCDDDDPPEAHLEFTDEGAVKPALDRHGKESKKGKTSIQVYGLHRGGLVQQRSKVAKDVKGSITKLKLAEVELDKQPNSAFALAVMTDEISFLKRYSAPDAEYSGMTRQLIQKYYGKIPT